MSYTHTLSASRGVQIRAKMAVVAVMIVAKFADTGLTLVMIQSGRGVEYNPVSVRILEALGPTGLWIRAVLAIVLVVAALELWSRFVGRRWLSIAGYLVAIGIFAAAAAHNASIWLYGLELIPVSEVLAS